MAVRKYYTYLKLTRYSLSILLALTKKITEVGRHVIQVTSPSVQISCRGCSKNVYRFFFSLNFASVTFAVVTIRTLLRST